MRVVAIYHETTRKVLGYVPRRPIREQGLQGHEPGHPTNRPFPEFIVQSKEWIYRFQLWYDKQGQPYKIEAASQEEADLLMFALPCDLNIKGQGRFMSNDIIKAILYGSRPIGVRTTFTGLGTSCV